MKLPVALTTFLLLICLTTVNAKSDPASAQDGRSKLSQKLNSLSTTPKPETYQQQLQYQQLYQPQQIQPQVQYQQPIAVQPQAQVAVQPQSQVHLIQRALYIPQQHNQPATMILIAQPAYVHANVGYGAGQVPNYYQNAVQARYLQQVPVQQQVIQQAPVTAHTLGNYQVVPAPVQYQNLVHVPAHLHQVAPTQVQAVPSPGTPQQQPPLQLGEIAQLAAQQYSRFSGVPQNQIIASHTQLQPNSQVVNDQPQAGVPIRSLPPIITGFENFSPEQQEKIKAQLSAHFGVPLQPLPTQNQQQQQQQQQTNSGHYNKFQSSQSGQNSDEFVPSQQIKNDASSSSSNSNFSKLKYSKL